MFCHPCHRKVKPFFLYILKKEEIEVEEGEMVTEGKKTVK